MIVGLLGMAWTTSLHARTECASEYPEWQEEAYEIWSSIDAAFGPLQTRSVALHVMAEVHTSKGARIDAFQHRSDGRWDVKVTLWDGATCEATRLIPRKTVLARLVTHEAAHFILKDSGRTYASHDEKERDVDMLAFSIYTVLGYPCKYFPGMPLKYDGLLHFPSTPPSLTCPGGFYARAVGETK